MVTHKFGFALLVLAATLAVGGCGTGELAKPGVSARAPAPQAPPLHDARAFYDNATNAVKFVLGTTSGVYAFFKWRDFVLLDKNEAGLYNAYSFEKASIRNSSVVLAVALTRAKPNVILTARELDNENPDVVLYQRSVLDTPNADPTLTAADIEALSAMRLTFSPEPSGAPYTYAGAAIGLYQYADGSSPAATVIYDNFELWTYRVPITHYVDANSASPAPPYTNWATAAHVIQGGRRRSPGR